MYKVRVILDTQEDVIRTLVVDKAITLESLHQHIAKSFGFDGAEMASFYMTDEEWNQGEEIPLFNMAEAGEGISMATCILNETLPQVNDKLIYVYDFFHMWTFYVEVIEQGNESVLETKTILAVGEIPKEAPEKEFKADKLLNDFDDEFKDEFNDFERLDDFDFDNY
ncbi:hypothetical protein WH52_06320 [Tenacibaculum holothuriorum]|uniref:Plasmid pRiA4b Orf3-like domain-containing protein n=1 Tax=Tenacibaculum holothuriorum TaxID=1635173 RepID=A0A1Y2PD19_9FLAO|nr:hypothetical protein [Tenacibaculum holothuriorum]OSY88373.1 hypothetical protein WH52_06320 [Tenacibaculum holothuriorum]